MEHVLQVIEVVGQKYFILGFISGFLYGAWVAWSLNGKSSRA